MAISGAILKLLQTFLYAIEFGCAAIILAIYSYFLSVLAGRNIGIPTWEKAVEGISGAAVLYLIFAVLLTCFLGGKTFFAFLAIVLDILFCGAFIAIAVLTRDGVRSCSGNNVHTPLGNGQSSAKNGYGAGRNRNTTFSVSLGTACRLNKAASAVSIIGAILFLISALVQLFLGRHHQKEKRYGPGPSNNYTFGSGNRKFWQRRRKNRGARDAELGAFGGATAGGLVADKHHSRPSHETGYTGSTAAPNSATYENPNKPLHSGYHTAPTGGAVNPYGYDNTQLHHTPATNY
jgi:putative Ca2+/H+ antiporter (TMEM165/GDT1 family)